MTLVIKGARLIDGTGRAPLDQMAVTVEGQRIGFVGPEDELDTLDSAIVIDAGGRTLLPALMDLYVGIASLSVEERRTEGVTEKTIASSILRGVANGRRCLDAGVTTVRVDLSGHHGIFALKDAFASGLLDGPRLIVPGRAICITGGHAWEGGLHEADGADGVRKAARQELKAGADWLKLMATGGASSATERAEDNQMTREELKAGVDEAHKKGKYAFAHVSCAEGARNCITAGVDSIEHGIMLEWDIVQAMKEKGIFLVPTLGVYHRLVERGEKGFVPEHMYRKATELVEEHARSFRMALEAGVKIAAGTDSGAAWYPAGEGLLYELEVMNQEGMAPMDVLISATSRAAECLHMKDDLGSVQVGKLADLLIVDGDPLASVSALRSTWMVLKAGRVVFRR